MSRGWSFLSNYGLVLLSVARRPDLRLREIAEIVGITPRTTQTIVSDLVEEGFLERSRVGRRNRYQIREELTLPDRGPTEHDVGNLVGAFLSGPGHGRRTRNRHAVVLGCSDHRFQESLRDLLSSQGLVGRAELILWPGGAAALTGPNADLLIGVLAEAAASDAPARVLLTAHERCAVGTAFDHPNEDPLTNARDIRSHRARTTSLVEAVLGIHPETWWLTASGARRLDAPGLRGSTLSIGSA